MDQGARGNGKVRSHRRAGLGRLGVDLLTGHQDLAESHRWVRKGLYVVAGMYTAIGLALSVSAALAGDRLSTFLGFLIVTGAIAALGLFTQLLRIEARMSSVASEVENLRRSPRAAAVETPAEDVASGGRATGEAAESLGSVQEPESPGSGNLPPGDHQKRAPRANVIEAAPAVVGALGPGMPRVDRTDEMGSGEDGLAEPHEVEAHVEPLNLAAIGSGVPAALAAAVLPRDRFPRLVRMLDVEPPATGAAPRPGAALLEDEESVPAEGEGGDSNGWQGLSVGQDGERMEVAAAPVGMTTRNLLREWKLAVREGDLATCRRVYSAIVDLSEPGAAAPLREILDRLADQTEDRLRRSFADCVRRGDFAKALVLGRQLCELLPDRAVRGEFEEIRPVLERKANAKMMRAYAGDETRRM